MSPPPVPPAWHLPVPRRDRGRLLGGVCTGLSAYLTINATLLRIVFSVLIANGVGVLLYLALWMLMPAAPDDAPPPASQIFGSLLPGSDRRRRRAARAAARAGLAGSAAAAGGGATGRDAGRDAADADHAGRVATDEIRHRRRLLIAYVVLGAAIGSLLGAAGFGIGGSVTLPLTLAGIGALLIWWRVPQSQRLRWSADARHYGSWIARRGPLLVVLGGVGLVIAGVASFLAANDALQQARAGALAIGATLVGVLIVTAPWLIRLLRELTEERRARIREHERAELAAHVHDSVLQTLALIQSDAVDAEAVRRLARSQERELRAWLYQSAAQAPVGLAALLREAAADVEDAYGVTVDVVVVGDAPLDEGLRAIGAAAREAMVNSAKSSGAALVSVFAEVTTDGAEVFVRDRGHGFDLGQIPDDRHGIRDSIIGRMQRHGGDADIRTSPDGTEVTLSLARRVKA